MRRFRYGESSLLVHVITPEHGRLSALAKGAYRPRSGYYGVLDLFDTLRLAWSRGPRSELGLLTAGSLEKRRRRIAADLERYRAGLAVLELAGLGAREGHEERELFTLVEDALDLLAETGAAPGLVGAAFDLRFLALAGLAPALTACASCGRALGERGTAGQVPFSTVLGGRLCDACAGEAAGRRASLESLPLHTIRVARSLMDTPLRMLSRTRLDPGRTERVRFLARRFLEAHLETRLRAWGPHRPSPPSPPSPSSPRSTGARSRPRSIGRTA